MISIIIWSVVCVTVLGAAVALLLTFVAQKFKVEEDLRIDEIEKVLPGANCGGCGKAGCRDFASTCVKSMSLEGNFCPVGGNDTMAKVAKILGLEVKEMGALVAVVRCNGCSREKINEYDGPQSCKIKSTLYAGDTLCRYGCLGCGDCVRACSFGAISMDSNTGLPVVDENKCKACGACLKACPKNIIELRNKGPRGMRVFVSCVSKDRGAVARKACVNACIGCAKCVKVCAHEAMTVEQNLCYIDFTKCKLCKKCVSECPTGAIHSVNFPILKASK